MSEENSIRMKKGFDVFEHLEEKEKRRLERTAPKLEKIIKGNKRFIHMPGEAFESIRRSHLPEYDYIKDGLYVMDSYLKVDNDIRQAAKDICLNVPYSNGKIIDFMNWNTSQELVQNLGGKLMTAAELYCIVDYLQENADDRYDDALLEQITYKNHEWLDGYVQYNAMSIDKTSDKYLVNSHCKIRNRQITSTACHKMGEFKSPIGKFDFKDIDMKTGFPEKTTLNAQFSYGFVVPTHKALATSYMSSSMRLVTISTSNLTNFNKIRLCYTKEEFDRRFEDAK